MVNIDTDKYRYLYIDYRYIGKYRYRKKNTIECVVQLISSYMIAFYTLSGRIGKVVARLPCMLKVATLQDRIPAVAELHRFILCTRRSGGTAYEGGGCDQSIGYTVSDAIVRSWLWSTATRSSQLGYFSNYCK